MTAGEDFIRLVAERANASRAEPSPDSDGTILMRDVQPKAIRWLWAGRIPLAMPTVLTGLPKTGKSTILYDRAAHVSRTGRMVLIVTAEDHLEMVVRPRLEAAGADLDFVRAVVIDLTLPDDVGVLERLARKYDAALLVIDPLMAFVSDQTNSHRDHHVRRVLKPLSQLAESTGCAVVTVVHSNKDTGSNPLLRVSGSIGITGAARSVLIAAASPDEDDHNILAVAGGNYAGPIPALAYRIRQVDLGEDIVTSVVEWLGERPDVDVSTLLSDRDPEEKSATAEARAFLIESGVRESPQSAAGLVAVAGDALGITEKTLQRARRSLGIPAWKDGFGGPGMWGPRPGSSIPDSSVPVHNVHNGGDLRERAVSDPILDIPGSVRHGDVDASCEVCHEPLTKVFPNQRRHPACLDGEPRAEDPMRSAVWKVVEVFPGTEVAS